MTSQPKIDPALEKIPPFRGLNAGECHQLLEIAREKTFQPGEKVLEQGKSSQYLWIVVEGRCEVVCDTMHDGAVVLAELTPYSLFGEMSFFSPAPHSANVVAKTPVKLLSISRADYDDLIRDNVPGAYKLAYNIVENVAAKLRMMDQRVADLAGEHRLHKNGHGDDEQQLEWYRFRHKLFDGWNL